MKNAPSFEENPDLYRDWGNPREFTMLDRGIGECAGEVISASQFDLADAEREVFEAQLELEKKNTRKPTNWLTEVWWAHHGR